MNKIVVFAPPAHGHVNPSLPVVRELVRRGDQVIYYNHEDFREKIEGTGCTFRPYPPTDMSAAKITEILRGGNLAAVINLIMKSTEILLPFSIEELEREKPDMVIIDSIAVWGRMAATIQQLPTVAFMAFFLMYGTEEEKRLPINLRHILQWLPEIPGTVIPFIRIIFKYGFRMLPPFKSFLPLRGDNNLFFTSKEFHPHSPLLNDSFHFVGPSISDTTPDTHFIPSENTDDVIGDEDLDPDKRVMAGNSRTQRSRSRKKEKTRDQHGSRNIHSSYYSGGLAANIVKRSSALSMRR